MPEAAREPKRPGVGQTSQPDSAGPWGTAAKPMIILGFAAANGLTKVHGCQLHDYPGVRSTVPVPRPSMATNTLFAPTPRRPDASPTPAHLRSRGLTP